MLTYRVVISLYDPHRMAGRHWWQHHLRDMLRLWGHSLGLRLSSTHRKRYDSCSYHQNTHCTSHTVLLYIAAYHTITHSVTIYSCTSYHHTLLLHSVHMYMCSFTHTHVEVEFAGCVEHVCMYTLMHVHVVYRVDSDNYILYIQERG